MLRNVMTLALAFGICTPATADIITIPLDFVPATSTYNTITISIDSSIGDDSDTSKVLDGSYVQLTLDYSFDAITRAVTSVNYLDFSAGTYDLESAHFDLGFLADIDATGVGGTFYTPSPHGSISSSTTTGAPPYVNTTEFPTNEHNVVINRGTIKIDPLIGDTTYYYLNQNPIEDTVDETGTLTTTLESVVGGVATYNVELVFPAAFEETIEDVITATISGSGTFKATGSFTVAPSNQPPVANDDPKAGFEVYYQADEDHAISTYVWSGVLNNDTDADSDPLTAYKITNPEHGSLILNSTGWFTYTPDENYNGTDSFTYKAFDGDSQTGWSDEATVTLTINAVNDPPDAADDLYWLNPENTVLSVPAANGVLVNDSDVEDDPLTAAKETNPAHGSVTVGSNGFITYVAGAGYDGSDSFTYKAFDSTDWSTAATVTIMTKIPGDANTDGVVDDDDAVILAANWGDSASLVTSWALGDFDRDGVVGPRDAAIMAANWGYYVELPGGGAGATAVPEPSVLILLVGALAGLALIRR
ncbi:MAG: tandem-95 repeat protein [Pirellulales bacterium]|nr:tandem-95 repeat protein [Pirellulales bacterium]